jgi:osmotically-inducible protein OsmY
MTDIIPESNASPSGEQALLAELTRALEAAGLFVVAEVNGTRLVLSGEVASLAERQAALDIAAAVAAPRGLRVDDGLDVMPTFPDSALIDASGAEHGAFGYLTADRDRDERLDAGLEDEPDFAGDVGTRAGDEPVSDAETYFAPTDPVLRPAADAQSLAVVGGFAATSMDTARREAGYDPRRDDAITEDVLRELREDALTTELVIRVGTRAGVVYLRGEVPTVEDAENAEAVASRVGGVKEVREELVVASLKRTRPD